MEQMPTYIAKTVPCTRNGRYAAKRPKPTRNDCIRQTWHSRKTPRLAQIASPKPPLIPIATITRAGQRLKVALAVLP